MTPAEIIKTFFINQLTFRRNLDIINACMIEMETYRSGRNENDSKSFCLEIGTWVRIPPSPPSMKVSLDRMRVKAHPIGLFRDFFNLNFKKKTKDRKMAFLGTDRIRTDTLP